LNFISFRNLLQDEPCKGGDHFKNPKISEKTFLFAIFVEFPLDILLREQQNKRKYQQN